MLRALLILGTAAVLEAVPAAAQQAESDKTAMEVARVWWRAAEPMYSKQDAAGFSELHTPDATFLPAVTPVGKGGVIHGRQGIKDFFVGVFRQGLNRASASVLEAHAIDGSAVWAVGELRLSGEREGKPIQFTTRFGQILIRSDKAWLARMTVVTSDAPPGAGPAK